MDKIFDKETVKYIKALGILDDAIFNLQKNKLKEYAIQKLSLAIIAIEKEDYSLIEKDTFFSPAGDGYGSEDTCLNFGGIMGEIKVNIEELFDIIQGGNHVCCGVDKDELDEVDEND